MLLSKEEFVKTFEEFDVEHFDVVEAQQEDKAGWDLPDLRRVAPFAKDLNFLEPYKMQRYTPPTVRVFTVTVTEYK